MLKELNDIKVNFQKSLKETIKYLLNFGKPFMITFRPDTTWEEIIEDLDEDNIESYSENNTLTIKIENEQLEYAFLQERSQKECLHFIKDHIEYVIPLEDIEVLWFDLEFSINFLRNPFMVNLVEYQFHLEEMDQLESGIYQEDSELEDSELEE